MVKASDLDAEGPRFEPWQRHLVQLSYLLRGGAVAMVTELALKLIVEAQVVKVENTISVGHCVIPLGKGLVPHCSVVRMGL